MIMTFSWKVIWVPKDLKRVLKPKLFMASPISMVVTSFGAPGLNLPILVMVSTAYIWLYSNLYWPPWLQCSFVDYNFWWPQASPMVTYYLQLGSLSTKTVQPDFRKIAIQFFIITTPECEVCIVNTSPFLIEHLFNSSHCSIPTNSSSLLLNPVLSASLDMLRSYLLSLHLALGLPSRSQISLVLLPMKTL